MRYNVAQVLAELGIDYDVSGDNANACCPFHQERHPSWGIHLETGQYLCFTCGAKGAVPRLVKHMRQCSWEDAILWAQERRSSVLRNLNALPEKKRRDDNTLKEMNEAKLALFDPPPRWALNERAISVVAAKEYGILWDWDKDYWILPIRDPKTHELWGWQERAGNRGNRYFRNRPKNVPKSRTLFGLPTFGKGGTAVLVESPLDVARLESVGCKGGLASYGAGVSSKQLDILARVAGQVVLALDNDPAGLRRMGEICSEFKLIPIFLFNYEVAPGIKDVGDMSAKEIHEGIRTATSKLVTRFE